MVEDVRLNYRLCKTMLGKKKFYFNEIFNLLIVLPVVGLLDTDN